MNRVRKTEREREIHAVKCLNKKVFEHFENKG